MLSKAAQVQPDWLTTIVGAQVVAIVATLPTGVTVHAGPDPPTLILDVQVRLVCVCVCVCEVVPHHVGTVSVLAHRKDALQTVANIFLGTVGYWDDPAIKALNANWTAPHTGIK